MKSNKCKICGCERTEMIQIGDTCRECLMRKKYDAAKKAAKKRYKGNDELRIAKIKATWKNKTEGIIIDAAEPFLSPKCSRCEKNPATEDHTCPYASDIHDCCQQCADDI